MRGAFACAGSRRPLIINEIREFSTICAVCKERSQPEAIEGYNTSSDFEDLEKEVKAAKAKGDAEALSEAEGKLAEKLASPEGKGFGVMTIERR